LGNIPQSATMLTDILAVVVARAENDTNAMTTKTPDSTRYVSAQFVVFFTKEDWILMDLVRLWSLL
jgi:hypothetical protein